METQSVKRTSDFFAEPFRIFAMVWLSDSPIGNMTAAGSETGFFVLENAGSGIHAPWAQKRVGKSQSAASLLHIR